MRPKTCFSRNSKKNFHRKRTSASVCFSATCYGSRDTPIINLKDDCVSAKFNPSKILNWIFDLGVFSALSRFPLSQCKALFGLQNSIFCSILEQADLKFSNSVRSTGHGRGSLSEHGFRSMFTGNPYKPCDLLKFQNIMIRNVKSYQNVLIQLT